jgi:hypothetical protein
MSRKRFVILPSENWELIEITLSRGIVQFSNQRNRFVQIAGKIWRFHLTGVSAVSENQITVGTTKNGTAFVTCGSQCGREMKWVPWHNCCWTEYCRGRMWFIDILSLIFYH